MVPDLQCLWVAHSVVSPVLPGWRNTGTSIFGEPHETISRHYKQTTAQNPWSGTISVAGGLNCSAAGDESVPLLLGQVAASNPARLLRPDGRIER